MARFSGASGGGSGAPGPTGPEGPAGADGEGFNWRGEWDTFPEPSYVTNDIVSYSGSTYRATSSEANSSNTPNLNTMGWDLFAAKGETGEAGEAGADGGFDYAQEIVDLAGTLTLDSSYAGKLILGQSLLVTIPSGWQTGQQVDFLQGLGDQIIFQAQSPAQIFSKDSKLKTAGPWSAASIKCIATNTYILYGDLGV